MKIEFICHGCDLPCHLWYEYDGDIIPNYMPAPTRCCFQDVVDRGGDKSNWVRVK